ncbi:MAG TPA: M10 family metallopeptidase C-terminal domain-containing protein, partial [Rhodocyclaceae bacterium]
AAVQAALAYYGQLLNVTFVATTDSSSVQMRFGTDNQAGKSAGYAYYPGYSSAVSGDVWLANDQSSNQDFSPGSYGWQTLLHEIGHALGLKHPGNYGSGDTSPFLPSTEDNNLNTVMSYNEAPNSLVVSVNGNSANLYNLSPETAMLYDIGTLQYLYGANTSYHSGNDSYTMGDQPFFKTIWDGGGNDTIDCSSLTRECDVNLTAGSHSSIDLYASALDAAPGFNFSVPPDYTGKDNLTIAWNCTIENAVGGSGNDKLVGNSVANHLNGGAGNDTLTGGGGNDLFDFTALLNTNSNVDLITDFVHGADKIELSASIFSGLGSAGALSILAFQDLSVTTSVGGAHIVYNPTTGALYYDTDGSGGGATPIQFATVGSGSHPALTAADFQII